MDDINYYKDPSHCILAQGWANLQNPAWTTLQYGSSSSLPSARTEVALVFNDSKLYMFGGFSSNYLNELWVLSESGAGASSGRPVWQKLSPTGTLPRK
jgi:hypothetical protein